MINSTTSDIKVSGLKPETIDAFRKMVSEKKESLEYLSRFGNAFEQAAASLVLEVGSQEVAQ